MASTWTEPAAQLVEAAPADWAGLWSLIDTAGHGALALSMALPLGSGTDLAFAGMDLGEAREELEWVHPELGDLTSARLGPLHLTNDVEAARDAIGMLVATAMHRAHALGDEGSSLAELGALGRAVRKLQSAVEEFARAVV